MSAATSTRLTPQQYLAIERQAQIRSEYYDGRMYAMSGASLAHNRIAVNLVYALRSQLEGQPCDVFLNDMRVCVNPGSLYTYPDLAVVCGEPELLDAENDTLLNPIVLVEVLSPSTEAYDRGRKFEFYQQILSLQEYVLVAQDRMRVDRYARNGGTWRPTSFSNPDDVLRLESLGCDVPLQAIYERVRFPDAEGGREQ